MESIRALITKNQKAVMGLVVLAIAFSIYNSFIKSDEPAGLESESRGIRDIEVGREIITTLNRLKTIQIEADVLEEPLFKRLVDFSQPLPNYSQSKVNPFAIEIPGAVPVQPVEEVAPVIIEDEPLDISQIEQDPIQ